MFCNLTLRMRMIHFICTNVGIVDMFVLIPLEGFNDLYLSIFSINTLLSLKKK